jgi:hypothetical protein
MTSATKSRGAISARFAYRCRKAGVAVPRLLDKAAYATAASTDSNSVND